MGSTGAYGDGLGHCFRVADCPCLRTPGDGAVRFAVTWLSCPSDRLVHLPREDAHIVVLHLAALDRLEVRHGDHLISACPRAAESIDILDLRAGVALRDVGAGLDCLAFYMPAALFETTALRLDRPRVDGLHCAGGTVDPVIAQLGAALLPVLPRPQEAAPAFIEHIATATAIHVGQTYGTFR